MEKGVGESVVIDTVIHRERQKSWAHIGCDKDFFKGYNVRVRELSVVHNFTLYIFVVESLP